MEYSELFDIALNHLNFDKYSSVEKSHKYFSTGQGFATAKQIGKEIESLGLGECKKEYHDSVILFEPKMIEFRKKYGTYKKYKKKISKPKTSNWTKISVIVAIVSLVSASWFGYLSYNYNNAVLELEYQLENCEYDLDSRLLDEDYSTQIE